MKESGLPRAGLVPCIAALCAFARDASQVLPLCELNVTESDFLRAKGVMLLQAPKRVQLRLILGSAARSALKPPAASLKNRNLDANSLWPRKGIRAKLRDKADQKPSNHCIRNVPLFASLRNS